MECMYIESSVKLVRKKIKGSDKLFLLIDAGKNIVILGQI